MKTVSVAFIFSVFALNAMAYGSIAQQRNPSQTKQTQQPADSSAVKNEVSVSQLEGTVEVSFMINAEGKAQILKINASNPALVDYVVKKLNKIQLEGESNSQVGQVIKYRFVFKKQA